METIVKELSDPKLPVQKKVITFSDEKNKPLFELSNLYPIAIKIDGKIWPSNEHFIQAKKYENTPHEEAIRRCSSSIDARKMGTDKKLPLRKDWEKVKDDIVMKVYISLLCDNLIGTSSQIRIGKV